MSISSSVGSSALKPIVSFILPKGLNWIINKIYGKKVLIVGPGRTGKTSFRNFLINGILLNVGSTSKTGEYFTKNGKIIKSQTGSFEINIKSLTDSPGQIGPLIHARSILDYRPHFLFVMLSLDKTDECKTWFEDFCECLYPIFRDDPFIAKKLNSIFILINKYDLVLENNQEQNIENYIIFKDQIINIANSNLNQVYYKIGNETKIPIVLPAICIKHQSSSPCLEEIINNLANKF